MLTISGVLLQVEAVFRNPKVVDHVPGDLLNQVEQAEHRAEKLETCLRNLVDRFRLCQRGIAETVELVGLVDEAEIALKQ